jgi:hypothetical protein
VTVSHKSSVLSGDRAREEGKKCTRSRSATLEVWVLTEAYLAFDDAALTRSQPLDPQSEAAFKRNKGRDREDSGFFVRVQWSVF